MSRERELRAGRQETPYEREGPWRGPLGDAQDHGSSGGRAGQAAARRAGGREGSVTVGLATVSPSAALHSGQPRGTRRSRGRRPGFSLSSASARSMCSSAAELSLRARAFFAPSSAVRSCDKFVTSGLRSGLFSPTWPSPPSPKLLAFVGSRRLP